MFSDLRGRGRALAPLLGFALLLAGPATAEPPSRVLFIGNSLTYWNELPWLVEAMAAAKGLLLSSEVVTRADASLEDHWNPSIRERIRGGGFKYVVLQQGPSSLPESRRNLREWTQRFAEEIRAAGAIPALYMVWPDRSRRAFFPQVIESYRLANADVKGVLLPAGEAWLASWELEPGLDLYGPDNFHPSRLGTYAAAATILSGLTGASPIGLPHRLKLRSGDDYRVDEKKAAVVLKAVASVTPPAAGSPAAALSSGIRMPPRDRVRTARTSQGRAPSRP